MAANEKDTTRVDQGSSAQTMEKATMEKATKVKAEKPLYKAPKVREIDPAGVLYAMFN
jgi:hypothetical protein